MSTRSNVPYIFEEKSGSVSKTDAGSVPSLEEVKEDILRFVISSDTLPSVEQIAQDFHLRFHFAERLIAELRASGRLSGYEPNLACPDDLKVLAQSGEPCPTDWVSDRNKNAPRSKPSFLTWAQACNWIGTGDLERIDEITNHRWYGTTEAKLRAEIEKEDRLVRVFDPKTGLEIPPLKRLGRDPDVRVSQEVFDRWPAAHLVSDAKIDYAAEVGADIRVPSNQIVPRTASVDIGGEDAVVDALRPRAGDLVEPADQNVGNLKPKLFADQNLDFLDPIELPPAPAPPLLEVLGGRKERIVAQVIWKISGKPIDEYPLPLNVDNGTIYDRSIELANAGQSEINKLQPMHSAVVNRTLNKITLYHAMLNIGIGKDSTISDDQLELIIKGIVRLEGPRFEKRNRSSDSHKKRKTDFRESIRDQADQLCKQMSAWARRNVT